MKTVKDEIPNDEELLEKADKKIRDNLRNWENLGDGDKNKTTEAIILSSFIRHEDEIVQALYDAVISVKTGICQKCNLPIGTGSEECLICETYKKQKNQY